MSKHAGPELLEAAEHVGRFLKTFDGLRRAMDFLTQHGSILQAAGEAEARRDRAIAAADAADARVAAANADVVRAEATAQDVAKLAHERAAGVEAQAKAHGDKMLADARVEAARLTDAAQAEERERREKIRKLERKTAEAQALLDQRNAQLAAINAEIAAIKSRLAG